MGINAGAPTEESFKDAAMKAATTLSPPLNLEESRPNPAKGNKKPGAGSKAAGLAIFQDDVLG